MMTARGLICVFAKPPIPGTTKTRLAAKVGHTHAAALAQAFLRDTWDVVSSVTWAKVILATTDGAASHFGLPDPPVIWLQGEGDLGKRLERIIRRGLAEANFVIAIGADTPGIPNRLLVDAREELASTDAVLGPSDDGGFYLIGLRRCPRGLLDDLPWSEPTTFAATRARLEASGMRTSSLDPWFDVDRPDDLERIRGLLERGALHAPNTARLLGVDAETVPKCG